MIKFKLILHRS